MKKAIIILITIIITINFTIPCGNSDNKDNYYPLFTTVINVENDIVTLEDNNGFTWEFEGAEDWIVGDICTCIMNDNGTEKIFDDVIVQTRYDGTK